MRHFWSWLAAFATARLVRAAVKYQQTERYKRGFKPFQQAWEAKRARQRP